MSTPTSARPTAPGTAAAPAFVPSPRQPSEPPATPQAAPKREPQYSTWDGGEPSRVFGMHRWMIAATGIACVIALFVAMIVLTWAAGGITPFNR
jgi:hypothetical protein